ncbi:MAG: disulfide bond formation protein B [Proteobacteria bacterium]|nr:disulfide bond formation protein B [Pseudomonadota bacterium]
MPTHQTRPLALALFVVCSSLLAIGLYLQHVKGIEPCPMCIMQRYALLACGLIGLGAGLHNPATRGRYIWSALLAVAALAGAGVAARQSWIQWYPPTVSECGPGLEYMLESFPLSSALPMIFRGAGDCSVVDWTFLGLSIANWSFLAFTTILLSLAVHLLQHRKSIA